MKGYTSELPEICACARLEGVNASFKDLSEVCGRIQGKKSAWAVTFLEMASAQEIPVLFKRHNKKLGHRRELGGRKGRYPHKAASFVLNALKSAIANGGVKGLGTDYTIHSACANKIQSLPRMASKGRTARSYLELAKIEVVLKPDQIPEKKEKKAEGKKEEKKTGGAKAPETQKAISTPMKKEERITVHHSEAKAKPEAAKTEGTKTKTEPKKEVKKEQAKEVEVNMNKESVVDHKKGDS